MGWGTLTLVALVMVSVASTTESWSPTNPDADALNALKKSLTDPKKVLESWDPSIGDACTYFHVTCTAGRITRVDLGDFNLSGRLVPELGKLDALEYLQMFKNKLQGTIPTEIGNLKKLKSLQLYDNNLTGPIPTSIGNLKSLIFLRLENNQLSGPIPIKEIMSIPTLDIVDLSKNKLIFPLLVQSNTTL